jgi:hypothetical protein
MQIEASEPGAEPRKPDSSEPLPVNLRVTTELRHFFEALKDTQETRKRYVKGDTA